MLPILTDFWDRLTILHQDLNAVLIDLPIEALDWSPHPSINSLAVLAAHCAGSERYWIGQVAGQEPAPRDRAAEFKTHNVDAAALIEQLDAVLQHSRSVLDRLTVTDLERDTGVIREGRSITGMWAILHSLEHVATHLGHMQVTREFWLKSAADNSSRNSEKTN